MLGNWGESPFTNEHKFVLIKMTMTIQYCTGRFDVDPDRNIPLMKWLGARKEFSGPSIYIPFIGAECPSFCENIPVVGQSWKYTTMFPSAVEMFKALYVHW